MASAEKDWTTAPPRTYVSPRDLERSLSKMKRFATGMLILMGCTYFATQFLEPRYGWLAPIVAFTEAAMVGALADWFAVVALFKHPLGLPIPRTAVIPRNKDRIGDALARFIRENILSPEVLEKRLATIDLTGWAGNWLSDEGNAQKLVEGMSRSIPAIIERFEDEDLREFARKEVVSYLQKIRISPIVASFIKPLTEEKFLADMITDMVRLGQRLLDENRERIIEVTKRESPRYIPEFIDEKVCNMVMGKVDEALTRVRDDDRHPSRAKIQEALKNLVGRLEQSDEFADRAERLKNELLFHPRVSEYIGLLLTRLKERIGTNLRDQDSSVMLHLRSGVQELGRAIVSDSAVREKMNEWLRSWIVVLIVNNRDRLVSFVSETVHRWDPASTSRRIELQVGRDLQWIRINGTLVGGLVGLSIYAVSWLLRNCF